MSDIKHRNTKSKTRPISTENFSSKKSDSEKPSRQNIPLRVLSRLVVAFSLMIVVYYSSRDSKLKTFARQTDTIIGKGLIVDCSHDYMHEVDKYERCAPRECKRFVSDNIISQREAEEMLYLGKKAFRHGSSDGGASIFDMYSGALSKGKHFVNIYKMKNADSLFSINEFKIFMMIKEKIKYAVAQHFEIDPNNIYLTSPSFFSEMTSRDAVTIHDEYWHPHVDKDTYKSFHYTTLLYLGDYGIDFKGGRFVFINDKYNTTVEPKKGRVSMFTSGSENFHYVEKVTSGVRYAVTIAFTCDKQFEIKEIKNYLFISFYLYL